MKLATVLSLACLGTALVASAGAASSFDGTYKGSQTTLHKDASSLCSNLDHNDVSLTIQGNHFTRRWGQAEIPVDVGPDGSFSGSTSTSDSRRLRTVSMKGKITDGAFEADIGTDICAAHLSLKKS